MAIHCPGINENKSVCSTFLFLGSPGALEGEKCDATTNPAGSLEAHSFRGTEPESDSVVKRLRSLYWSSQLLIFSCSV